MRPETLFEKFDLVADAPSAVAKLRELVLQLAVTGRLVPPGGADEPASCLLARARDERKALANAGRIRTRSAAPVRSEEQPCRIPEHWEWARLSEVGYELGQKVPDKRFVYIDVGSIDSAEGRISNRVVELEPNEAPSRARKLVAPGTVIYSTVRPYLLNVAIVERCYEPEPIASTAFAILHPLAGISDRYLFYWLRSVPFTAYVQAAMKGMAYPAINDQAFYGGPIALPPLAEQRQIVAKVDELMALCDQLDAQQQQRETRHAALARAALTRFAEAPTSNNLQLLFHPCYDIGPADLRKTILTLAIQGRLVPQHPDDQPAEELVEHIRVERGRCKTRVTSEEAKYFSPIERDEQPFAIPPVWAWVRLRCLSLALGDGLHGTPEYQDGTNYYFINGSNLLEGRVVIKPSTKTVSADAMKRHVKALTLNTVLVSINGTLGSIAYYNGESIVLGKSVCYLVLPTLIDKHFIGRVIESAYFTAYAADKATGTTIRNLGLRAMNSFPIPLPPLAEQRRIVTRVDELMALVDQLEAQLAASRTAAAKLLDAIVAELAAAGANGAAGVPE
jgi:type I restriction enzyme, S subunit